MTSDSQLSELQNEVKLKLFEAERTQLVHEETCRVLKQAQLDNEKLGSKLEVQQSAHVPTIIASTATGPAVVGGEWWLKKNEHTKS